MFPNFAKFLGTSILKKLYRWFYWISGSLSPLLINEDHWFQGGQCPPRGHHWFRAEFSECPIPQGTFMWPRERCLSAAAAAAAAKSLRLCLTLWDPIDGSPPGCPIPGILQARILEWVAISFSNAWKWKVKMKSLSCGQLFVTPWTAAHQASLPITNSRSLLKLMSIELGMPSNSSSVTFFSSCLQSFPASGSFPVSQFFASGDQTIRSSASASILPMNIQDWFPLGWTGWISLQSKGLSRVFSNTTVQKHQFFVTQPSLWSNSHIHTWLLENHSFDYST